MTKCSSFLLLAWVMLAVAACSGESPTDSGPSAQTACSDEVAAICAKTTSCSQTVAAERYADTATCQARETALCMNRLSAPQTSTTPAGVESCAGAYSSFACN